VGENEKPMLSKSSLWISMPEAVRQPIEGERWVYPQEHLATIGPFLWGTERDPRDAFALSDDIWDAWPYASNGREALRAQTRLRFRRLRSFLRPYAKWFCYERLQDRASPQGLCRTLAMLGKADAIVLATGAEALADIAPEHVFRELWDNLAQPPDLPSGGRSNKAVRVQTDTRPFWLRLQAYFAEPVFVPRTLPHSLPHPIEIGRDQSNLIPTAVKRQLVNVLALHRDGTVILEPLDHLRLCVLLLQLATGRRIDEILATPRGTGSLGPLKRLPAADGTDALWLQFAPNKDGPEGTVYVSPAWEELVTYCVQELIRYSDLVRSQARPSEQHLLVLTARSLRTAGGSYPNGVAVGLTYGGLRAWMNGGHADYPGAFKRWHITHNGDPDQPPYYYRTHRARHDRQTVLLQHGTPPIARLRDLNTRTRDAHLVYGHAWDDLASQLFEHATADPKNALMDKASRGVLVGQGIQVILETIEPIDNHGFAPGDPAFLTPMRAARLRKHPRAFELNRVPGGICLLAQGPVACPEFLHCVEATTDGCSQYVCDTENPSMLVELYQRAERRRVDADAAIQAGRRVLAGKQRELAIRAANIRDKAFAAAKPEVIDDVKARLLATRERLEGEQ
jgi:hypothetical protein